MMCYAEIAIQYETSPLLIKCLFEILEPLLPEKKSFQIKRFISTIDPTMKTDN